MKTSRITSTTWVLIVTGVIGACTQTPVVPVTTPAGTVVSRPANATPYAIDATSSDVEIRAYRGGTLARLGHNHVISVAELRGEVWLAPDAVQSSATLAFDVATLRVDEPARRQAAGADFASEPSEKDIAGTRRNMLSDALLDGANHPSIELALTGLSRSSDASSGRFVANFIATVKGQPYQLQVPIVMREESTSLTLSGEFSLAQTAIGLTPFTVGLGALKVLDEIDIRFRIVARAQN